MATERTLIIVKPDAVQRGLTGEIIKRFEQRGLRIIGMKFMQISKELAEKHYAIHSDKGFFNDLVSYMTSGPVMVQVLEGENAIAKNREIMGATNPKDAEPGTIRADHAASIEENVVHGSDGPDTAKVEIAHFFDEAEICPRTR